MTFFSRLLPLRQYSYRKRMILMSAREIADRELRIAVLSRDTQRINKAQDAMQAATHALMAHELGMWRG